jgi:general secretion pathway protein I
MQSYCAASLRRRAHLATKRSTLALPPSTVSRFAAGPHLATEASWPARNALHSLDALLWRSRRASAAGFSLLEVLVAFIILALVGTALFELFGGALNNASAADEYSRAALFAESRLTAAAVETPLREGGDQGVSEDGKYAWAKKIEPYVAPGTTAEEDRLGQLAAVRLWRISVTVSWPGTLGNQRSVSLASVRLARKQP